MLILYPDIKPHATHRIKVDDVHELYVEECGNTDGIPVLFIHGGPGGNIESFSRRFFDPEKYRVILYDQRGCGKSTPHAEIANNTTQALVSDIEIIREHLNIDKWMLFGGSWGATLALVYAQSYADRVIAMVLRGVFLARDEDFRWLYQDGANRIFPDAWAELIKPLNDDEKQDVVAAYFKRLSGVDELARMGAAKAWALWEGCCSTLRPNHNVLDRFCDPHNARSLAQIECHYSMNKAFLEPNQVMANIDKLSGIPSIIVHGRYDMVCPLEQAYTLHHAWADSELHIVRDAGHSSSEPSIVDALVRATDEMAKRFRNYEA